MERCHTHGSWILYVIIHRELLKYYEEIVGLDTLNDLYAHDIFCIGDIMMFLSNGMHIVI